MVRELSEYQPDRIGRVLRWPLREALIAYRARMILSARQQHQDDLKLWATIAVHSPKKMEPPKPPAILREVLH